MSDNSDKMEVIEHPVVRREETEPKNVIGPLEVERKRKVRRTLPKLETVSIEDRISEKEADESKSKIEVSSSTNNTLKRRKKKRMKPIPPESPADNTEHPIASVTQRLDSSSSEAPIPPTGTVTIVENQTEKEGKKSKEKEKPATNQVEQQISHYEQIDEDDFIQATIEEANDTNQVDTNTELSSEENMIHKKDVQRFWSKNSAQKGVFVENPISGQFYRVTNMYEAKDEIGGLSEMSEDVVMGDDVHRLNNRIQKAVTDLHSTFRMLVFSIEGLVAGISFILLVLSFTTSPVDRALFASWFSPIAGWIEKLFHISSSIGIVGSLYMFINEWIPASKKGNVMNFFSFFSTMPVAKLSTLENEVMLARFRNKKSKERSLQRIKHITKAILGAQSVLYSIGFYMVLGNLVQEDYFSVKYSRKKEWYVEFSKKPSDQSSREFNKRITTWYVLNTIRCVCLIAAWILSLICMRINRQLQTDEEFNLHNLQSEYDSKLEHLFQLEQHIRVREEEDAYNYSLNAFPTMNLSRKVV